MLHLTVSAACSIRPSGVLHVRSMHPLPTYYPAEPNFNLMQWDSMLLLLQRAVLWCMMSKYQQDSFGYFIFMTWAGLLSHDLTQIMATVCYFSVTAGFPQSEDPI